MTVRFARTAPPRPPHPDAAAPSPTPAPPPPTGPPTTRPVSPDSPDGISTASTAAAPGFGRVIGAAEPGPVGGVNDQVHRTPTRRPPATSAASITDTRAPRPGQQAGCHPTIAAVVAPTGHHDHLAAVGASQHPPGRRGHREPGPLDEHLDRIAGTAVHLGHLGRGEDRDHPTAATTAEATVAVWVIDSSQARTPCRMANDAARPVTTRSGGPPGGSHHLHVAPTEGAQPHAEGFHHRLLGREPGGQGGNRVGQAGGVVLFAWSEQPLGQAWAGGPGSRRIGGCPRSRSRCQPGRRSWG